MRSGDSSPEDGPSSMGLALRWRLRNPSEHPIAVCGGSPDSPVSADSISATLGRGRVAYGAERVQYSAGESVLHPRGTHCETYTVKSSGADQRGPMSKYLIQVGFTAEAWAAMSREPQHVVERVRPSAEALGGSIESLFFCFGDYDLVGVVDFPDNRGAAAWSVAVSSGGDVRAFKTTPLLTIEEGLHALGQASEVSRPRPPSAPS